MKHKIRSCTKNLDAHVLMANLFVMLVGFLGLIRAYEWIVADKKNLTTVSPLYGVLSSFGSIESLGIILLIASAMIFSSVFFKNVIVYYLLLAGSFFSGIIYFFFSLASLAGASLFVTSYTAMALMVAQLFLLFIGVVGIWKKK